MSPPLRFPPPAGHPDRDRVIALRRSLGLSQAALGSLIGVTGATVSRWERGRASPSDLALTLLAQLERKQKYSFLTSKCAGCRSGCG